MVYVDLPRTRGVLLFVASVLCVSCSAPYEVRIRFSNASLHSAATRVEVALVESCEGQVSGPAVGVIRQVEFGIDEPIEVGSVDAGEYGLYVRATSADCTVIATGCSQVSIDNTGGVLEVLVQPAAGQACMDGFSCQLGQCVPGTSDAGGIDGSPDTEVDGGICMLPVPTETNIDPASGQVALDSFGCMVRGGRLFCFGPNNDSGQLSGSAEACEGDDGCLEEIAHPDDGSWSEVSTGRTHACAFDGDGRLFCWGSSDFGALGRAAGREGVAEAASFGVSRVSCGGNFTCALKSNTRTLHCWGNDASGQTGVVTEGSCAGGGGMIVSLPTRISAPEDEVCPPLASSPEVELWSDLTTSSDTGCSLLQDGRGYCWGGVANGTTGADEVACFPGCRATPIGRWRRLSENVLHHRCGIRDDGELLCWGFNGRGQLGVGSVTEDPTPDVGVCDPAPGDRGSEILLSETTPVTHPSGGSWADVSAGFFHTCALDSEGAVYCWGENDQNAVAEGAESISTSPVRVPLPDDVRATEVLAGNRFSCARSEDEGLYCWGARSRRCAGVENCPAVHRIPFPE